MSKKLGHIVCGYTIEETTNKKTPYSKRARRRKKQRLKRIYKKYFNLNQFLFIKRSIINQ